jgi:hypothetical protein
MWPQQLLSTGIPSGDAELNIGAIIDKKIGFGFAADFLWNIKSVDAKDTTDKWITLSAEKNFMIPVMGYILIDPVPDLIVHPVAKFEIGYNSVIFGSKKRNPTDPEKKIEDRLDYYYGLILKGCIDALYNLGEQSSVFLGVEYQWAETQTSSDAGDRFRKRDMSGIGLRGGFRVVY